jgi:hypothetical protein
MAKFMLGLLWLGASVYLGYVLTARSFAFLEDPGFGLGEDAPFTQLMQLDVEAVSENLPAPGEDPATWYASLPPETQACLRASVSEERFRAALAGEELKPTPAEALAISTCLQ